MVAKRDKITGDIKMTPETGLYNYIIVSVV